MDALDSVVQLWELIYPEDAYQAGVAPSAGRFFSLIEERLEEVRRRSSEIEASLERILDRDLRETARFLLQSFRLCVDHPRPHQVISRVASGLYAIIVKNESDRPFVLNYLYHRPRVSELMPFVGKECDSALKLSDTCTDLFNSYKKCKM